MTIKLKILPVFQGDAIIVHCVQDDYKILVDTGTKRSYSRGVLKSEIEKAEKFDLLVLTHTDEDHIGGLIKYLDDEDRKKNVFKRIWFNNGEIIQKYLIGSDESVPQIQLDDPNNLELSVKQGVSLESKLINEKLISEDLIYSESKHSMGNINCTVLSPNKDDLIDFYHVWELENKKQLEMTKGNDYHKSVEELLQVKYTENGTLANKTSIAFILNYGQNQILLMGDSFASVIEENIRKLNYNEQNKLHLDLVKVSHHGSGYGMNYSLLNIIDCNKFVISTNGSNGLPTKECLARIVAHKKEKIFLYFNYKNEITEGIFSSEDYEKYDFEINFLSMDNNYTISIGE